LARIQWEAGQLVKPKEITRHAPRRGTGETSVLLQTLRPPLVTGQGMTISFNGAPGLATALAASTGL
jgi:hypothetical protein